MDKFFTVIITIMILLLLLVPPVSDGPAGDDDEWIHYSVETTEAEMVRGYEIMKSGMPCEVSKTNQRTQRVGNIERSEDEPQTVEEVLPADEPEVPYASGEGSEAQPEVLETGIPGPSEAAPVETVPVLQVIPSTSMVETQSAVPGLSPQETLRTELASAGIDWWYPYALAQAQQESSWNPWAVSPDGKDKGLFQYREMYWTEPESIFDVNAQIRKYVSQVSARIAAGLSIEEIISRHLTSDYVTEINWDYVNLVLSHLNQ
jgi:hypothetical protein